MPVKVPTKLNTNLEESRIRAQVSSTQISPTGSRSRCECYAAGFPASAVGTHLVGGQVSCLRRYQMAIPARQSATAVKMAVSRAWKVQYRLAGW